MTLKETIQAWTDKTIVDLKKSYNDKGFRASGTWERSLSGEVVEKEGNIHSLISGQNYTKFMEEGRGITSPAKRGRLRGIIRKWIDDKGIVPNGKMSKDSLAFLIARKIDEKGIQIRPDRQGVVTNVIKENMNDILKDMGKVFTTEIKSDLLKAYGRN